MPNYGMPGGFGGSNCVCSLPTLVILILIILQFSKKRHDHDHDDCDDKGLVGNGVLFIIALFFLSCAGCGRGNVGY